MVIHVSYGLRVTVVAISYVKYDNLKKSRGMHEDIVRRIPVVSDSSSENQSGLKLGKYTDLNQALRFA